MLDAFGVHLPLMSFDSERPSISSLLTYVRTARELGFEWITANDHFVFHAPWLDGPTSLAAVLPEADQMTLATTIVLPVLRHPIPVAKAMGALDVLSDGRIVVGVGPASHRGDYEALGVPWEERWPRFEEAIAALRALWNPDQAPFDGRFYSTVGIRLEPEPARAGGPPIWIGSWGSDVGLRRVARLGDGWFASAYNATPELFRSAHERLGGFLEAAGRGVDPFPHALASMFFHITEDKQRADRAVGEIASALGRQPEEARKRLLIGSVAECADKLSALEQAGVERILIWPIGESIEQIEVFAQSFVSPAP